MPSSSLLCRPPSCALSLSPLSSLSPLRSLRLTRLGSPSCPLIFLPSRLPPRPSSCPPTFPQLTDSIVSGLFATVCLGTVAIAYWKTKRTYNKELVLAGGEVLEADLVEGQRLAARGLLIATALTSGTFSGLVFGVRSSAWQCGAVRGIAYSNVLPTLWQVCRHACCYCRKPRSGVVLRICNAIRSLPPQHMHAHAQPRTVARALPACLLCFAPTHAKITLPPPSILLLFAAVGYMSC